MSQRLTLYIFLTLLLALIVFGFFISRLEAGSEVNRAVLDAINEPGGGNYAAAVAAVRQSDEPTDVQAFHIGRLVVGAYDRPGARHPAETIVQGLRMLEQAASGKSDSRGPAQQQLRMIFERGIGAPPNKIPPNAAVANCWRVLENDEPGDPARCIHLREQQLPGLK